MRIGFHPGYPVIAGLALLVVALIVIQSLPRFSVAEQQSRSAQSIDATKQKSRSGTVVAGQASVIDGDTIDIHGTRIRLAGIDAPESRQTCETSGSVYRCGQKAALALSDLISTRTVQCEQSGIDRWRRIIARCFVGDIDLSSWMVSSGWAVAYRKYSSLYVSDEERARNKSVGIWAGTFTLPEQWRIEQQKGK